MLFAVDAWSHGVEFGVLGPLQAVQNGKAIPIDSAHKPRLVLAALLSCADLPVSVDWLIGTVWGEHPPASARRNIHHYIHRLRTGLGNDRILSRTGGYMIRVGVELDAARFRQLGADGDAALSDGEPGRARDSLRAALDLWRGSAYSEFAGCRPLADEAARLEELRLTVSELWAEAELALGHHATTVEALSQLVLSDPFRERLRGLLMRALYGSGRRADALELFRSTRVLLVDQLGIEPGPQLTHLHEQMLRGDPLLTFQPAGPATVTAPASGRDAVGVQVPRQLPYDVAGFVGRQDALKNLDELLPVNAERTVGSMVIAAVVGAAGVGKTALAVHWAHRAADHFLDGQLYINLRGYATGRPLQPIEALTTILTALGTPPDQVPVEVAAAAARYRSQLAGRRVLILLDNARSAAQVRPLLPASPGCLVLITSRDRLTGLVAQDGARRLSLPVFNHAESVELLSWMSGPERAAAEPAAVADLAHTCAHLPLALRIAGAGLADRPHSTVARYVTELAGSGPIAALAVDDDIAVRGAFELSYRTLPEPAQQLFRRLGLVPCPDFTTSAAAALTGSTEADALVALEKLAAAHLIGQHASGRYTLHDLLRQYAADLAATRDSQTQRLAAVHGLYDWLTAMSVAAAELLYPESLRLPPLSTAHTPRGLTGTAAALEWLDAERHNVVAAILHAARNGPRPAAWRCADAVRSFCAQRAHVADSLSISRAAVAAARAEGDLQAQAASYLGLAHAHLGLDNHSRSITYLLRALDLAAESEWDRAEASAAGTIAVALGLQGRTTEAIHYLERALHVHERIDWPLGRAKEMDTLATAYRDVGRLREGHDLATQARAIYHERAANRGEAIANLSLGELHTLLGELVEAERSLDSALSTFRSFGSRRGEAHCRAWLTRVHCDAGHLDRAEESARTALQLANEIEEPELQAMARYALALVHQTRGDHAGAIQLHRDALNIAEQVGIRYTVGEALLGLATAIRSQGDNQQAALDHAALALNLGHQCGYAVIEGRAHTILGQIHLQLRDPARALDHARQALTSHQDTGHRIGEADSHLLLATIQHHLDDHAKADHHTNTAQTLYRLIGAPRTLQSEGMSDGLYK